MFFKRFRFQVILRVLLLAASIFTLLYLLLHTRLYTAAAVVGCLVLYQAAALIHFVEKSNQALQRFFSALKTDDVSQTFSQKELGPSFAGLADAFNDIAQKIRQVRSEREGQYRYLQTILHHVGIGIISFGDDGSVDLINSAAKRLLRVSHLKNIASLESFSPALVERLLSLKAGAKTLVKVAEEDMELMIRAAEFRLQGKKFTLVSLENIKSELQEKEMEAWQNLVRVLTHEIMNSMTPITSMAATVLGLLEAAGTKEAAGPSLLAEQAADVKGALKTIHKRSQGLIDFVNAYRSLTLIPKPRFKLITVQELFNRVENLLQKRLDERAIPLQKSVQPHTLELFADAGLVDQVLINLVLNSIDAFEKGEEGAASGTQKQPAIRLYAFLDDSGRVTIQVKDNGPGIAPEAVDKVFIPFFSTKSSGTGIGLSLSRQIMRLHKGTINVQSLPYRETTFTLKF